MCDCSSRRQTIDAISKALALLAKNSAAFGCMAKTGENRRQILAKNANTDPLLS
jgi:hypothetical protein